jgi:predicted histidine transporter YuiF (NhaC family)
LLGKHDGRCDGRSAHFERGLHGFRTMTSIAFAMIEVAGFSTVLHTMGNGP